jgi:thiamine-phosphate pyrophosphorylase
LGQEDFFDNNVFGRAERCDALNIMVPQDLAEKIVGISTGRSAPLIGLSTHAPAQAERALAANPAYIAIGPVYATGTKPGAKPVTLEYVRWAASHVTIPWFAIGGINLENLDNVLAAGARRICVVSAILNTENVAKACLEFRNRLGSPS